MSRHFISVDSNLEGGRIVVSGKTAHHILSVLRLRIGDELTFCDGNELDYHAVLADFNAKSRSASAVFEIKKTVQCLNELPFFVRLFQCLPKGDKLDLIIQKCTELGVSEIIPVYSTRSDVGAKALGKRFERCQAIAASAAGQSNRGKVPIICCLHNFDDAVQNLKSLRQSANVLSVVAYENEKNATLKSVVLNQSNPPSVVNLFIGPEGGFTNEEIQILKDAGVFVVSLGTLTLRTETAAIAAVSQIVCLLG